MIAADGVFSGRASGSIIALASSFLVSGMKLATGSRVHHTMPVLTLQELKP
jgi:hypothetical protein